MSEKIYILLALGSISIIALIFGISKKRRRSIQKIKEDEKKEEIEKPPQPLTKQFKGTLEVKETVSMEYKSENTARQYKIETASKDEVKRSPKISSFKKSSKNDIPKTFPLNNDCFNVKVYKEETKHENHKSQAKNSIAMNKSVYDMHDNTILNLMSELKNIEHVKTNNNRDNKDISLDLEKPVFINDEMMHEIEGYLEEDDFNSKDKFIEDLSDEFFDDDIKEKQRKQKNSTNTAENTFETGGRRNNEPEKIKSIEELKLALKDKREKRYELSLEEKIFALKEKEETHLIIKDDEFILILRKLFSELNSKFIEMNDNFIEERRNYLTKDEKIYASIIKFHIEKKEEYFLSVLSMIMNKFSINQEVLDNTLHFYFNLEDQEKECVKEIKNAYNDVYNAGLKYSIAPKNMTKSMFKKILKLKVELYEKLSSKGIYEQQVIEIMVNDNIYLEYGLENECILACEKKFRIYEDPYFASVVQQIQSYQGSSFVM